MSEFTLIFEGVWVADIFGQMTLKQSGQSVSGNYTGRGGGAIEGKVQGKRLNFTWNDNRQTKDGWGFFRALTDNSTLTGLWGYGVDKTKVECLIATRLQSSFKVFPNKDKQQLKYLGYDLVSQGRSEEARIILERSLDLYREERTKGGTWNLIKDTYLIDEINILTHLFQCYLQLGDYGHLLKRITEPEATQSLQFQRTSLYDKLLNHLEDALEIQRLLHQIEYLSVPKNMLASLADRIETWRTRLVTDVDRISALDGGQKFFQKLMKILVELHCLHPSKGLISSSIFSTAG